MSPRRRRDFLRSAAGVALALPFGARPALAQGRGDRALLERAIGAELELVAAYGRAPGLDEAARFRGHCSQHARGLSELLANRGGLAPAPRASTGQPKRPAALLEAEAEAVAGLFRAQGLLEDADLLPVLGSIMANHAQHLVVLRQLLGREPASLAFETGAVG